ncbi:RSM18 (YER050C) [Zygosaccharomyces parabailii]|nr:RSM18 (YER050C) [Zygosaccharomyces parabailii]CDH14402.1 related to 37S ribosomal protein RSM18,mitochondrial [Zygosaccharomyces bailii ISA1307]
MINRVCGEILSKRFFTSGAVKLEPLQIKLSNGQKKQINVGSINQAPANKKIDPRLTRKFQRGSVYDPFDFSLARIHLDKKYGSSRRPMNDLFNKFGVNPLDLYTSPETLSQFVTSTGRILHRDVTGLSAKNQRRLSKAVRRCQSIGLMSKVHKDVSLLPTRTSGKL